jgi:PKD repeat protein
MNLLKKGISILLLAGLMIISSCDDDDVTQQTGTSIVLSSFTATPSGDGTIITVTPLSVGVDSYLVDFGHNGNTETISEQNGSVSYDYPNEVMQVTYTITVTAMSAGQSDVVKSKDVTVSHQVAAPSSVPSSPSILDENVYAIFSDGIENGGSFTAYSNTIAGIDLDAGTAEYNEVEVGNNNVLQYSRFDDTIAATITFDPAIIIADAFGTGEPADFIHLDLHSVFTSGVNRVNITLGGETFVQTLINDEWTGLDIDFALEGITEIDNITIELAGTGTARGEATLNLDNIYLYREPLSIPDFTFDDVPNDYDVTFTDASELATSYSWDFGDGNSSTDANPTHSYIDNGMEATYMVTLTTTNSRNNSTSITKEVIVGLLGPLNPVILWGDLNSGSSDVYPPWKIANTPGNSNPFSGSGDGSCRDYDGVNTGTKTRGAKWGATQSADAPDGTADPGDTRYMYQAVTLSPNTNYIFEYEYAIRTGGSATNSVVAAILNGHYSDSDVALASNPLVEHVGTIAEGKFSDDSCSYGTTMQLQFMSNSVGEVSILFYAFTDKDAYVDNVKMYPL